MKPITYLASFFGVLLLIAGFLLLKNQLPELSDGAQPYDPPGSTDTRSKAISFQSKRVIILADGTGARNDFPGARMNSFERIGDNLYEVNILAENSPINTSPWYAFKIWSDKKKSIRLRLKYPGEKHRYRPDLSRDGKHFSVLPAGKILADTINQSVDLQLEIGPDTLWLAAQEIQNSAQNRVFTDSLRQLPFVSVENIGESTLGRPLSALTFGNRNAGRAIAVISRQHPPEVTGYLAAQDFLRILCDSSALSRTFREHFTVYSVPMMNPDGVDHGHWRHNAGGVDLNRDWKNFHQPESRAFKNFLEQKIAENKQKLFLGLDFHSTSKDIFYPFQAEFRAANAPALVADWLDSLDRSEPGEPVVREPSDDISPISKNYFFKQFAADALTYEVGDDTDRNEIRRRAETAARILQRMMLRRYAARK